MDSAPVRGARRIRVVLIHHSSPQRLVDARRTVEVVSDALSRYGEVQTSEIWRQPNREEIGIAGLVGRRLRQWWLERRWARHLGVGQRWGLSVGLLALRLLQLADPDHRRDAGRQAFVELVLTSKHVQAWRCAYDDDVDALVVLEDDARADAATKARLLELVDAADRHAGLGSTYADLAGGLDMRELRLTRGAEPLEPGVVRQRAAATNTTCAYLVGREVIQLLAEAAVRNPESARLPADWFINRCFLTSPHVQCLHASPHALAHGSFTGAVASSLRN